MDQHLQRTPVALASSLCALLCAGGAQAQCAKPTIPASGLPVTVVLDRVVTYSDGYKTKSDLLVPSVPPPSCGWPLVVFVHGLGSNRSADRAEQWGIAMRGYAVWAYDVRGQGDAISMNSPTLGHTFDGPTEKYDLAEQIANARAAHPTTLSSTLVGVTGFSQGGIHSWAAAALSGRIITAPGRAYTVFPKISAVAPRGFVAEPIEVRVQDGTLFERMFVDYAASTLPSSVLDPTFRTLTQNAFLADDPKSLNLAFQLDPLRPIWQLLPTTTVPVLWGHAFHDEIGGPEAGLDAFQALPKTTPARAVIGAIGHGAPDNDQQWELWNEMRVRWFDRFLWSEQNGIEREARVLTFQPPLDPTALRDKGSLWSPRSDDVWPPRNAIPARLYAHANGGLDPLPPASSGTPTTLTHLPQTGYTQHSFFASWNDRQTNTILAKIPLSERAFRTAPLVQDLELAGPVRIHLALVPRAQAVQVAALLRISAPGATGPFTIAVHGKAVRSATPNQGTTLEFDLGPAATTLPAGSVLELLIRNHWLREAPWARELVTAPLFTAFALDVLHGNTAADETWIELNVRTSHGVGLVSALGTIAVNAPAAMPLEIRGGYSRASFPYLITATLSGHDPLGVLPIHLDSLTQALLTVTNSPLTPGFLGVLDGFGTAQAAFDLRLLAPLPPGLSGERISFAGCVLDARAPFGIVPSAPLDLRLR